MFQSTHSLRSATYYEGAGLYAYIVSIHALLAECDSQHVSYLRIIQCFNPRTPCGVRQDDETLTWAIYEFQSTHSLRSATGLANHFRNMHPVSIHALLAECDSSTGEQPLETIGFNPRTPCGVRRVRRPVSCPVRRFNPRTPCGVRLKSSTGEQ